MPVTSYNSRTALLLGERGVDALADAHVVIVGVGGVGAYAAETVARAGVGRITLIDGDTVAESNLNRQLPALRSTVGEPKAEVMRRRILDINPDCRVTAIQAFIGPDNAGEFITDAGAWVIDAIDSITPKVNMLAYCHRNHIRVISSMGAGGRIDPTAIRYADIADTYHDGLAREVRKRLRKLGISSGIKVVFSTEQPRRSSLVMTDELSFKTSSFGTVAWLPATFGLMLGAYVVNHIAPVKP